MESMRYAERNLYPRAAELVGDRNPRDHGFAVQLRALDSSRSGATLGIGTLLALCSALLEKSMQGGMVVVGALNLGGGTDSVYNADGSTGLAAEKGATTIFMPVSARKQLFDLSDETATRITIQFYTDPREALLKSLGH